MAGGSSEPTPQLPQVARRHQRSRLVNTRFLIGLILVVLAIGGGGVIISAADDTTSMWSLRTALPRGTQLTPDDLVAVNARLPDSKGAYVGADKNIVGKTLTRDVGKGELLPSGALRERGCGSLVSIPVQSRHVPSTLQNGARIDVYATTDSSDKSKNQTQKLLSSAIVQHIGRPGNGALSSSGEWSLSVRVADQGAKDLVAALHNMAIDIAVLPAVAPKSTGRDDPPDVCAATPVTPANSAQGS
ncbi:MAG: hypothetical protein DLM55_03470 [Acidimicrobiales bacterium]|nr:MAG: hypothetical protein DLM55_03470 [Acidimicrobiales bacterium]